MNCEKCDCDCDELMSRQGFCMTYYVEWVCEDCFKELEGTSFDSYTEEDYYDVQVKTGN